MERGRCTCRAAKDDKKLLLSILAALRETVFSSHLSFQDRHLDLPHKDQLLYRDEGSGFQTVDVHTDRETECSLAGIERHAVDG